MSITNKKIDVLRRLFLGPLYSECKDNPMGVSREQLQKRLDKLVDDGCVLDCNLDEMVKTCNIKSHYPTCAKDRKCIEDTWPQQNVEEKFSYQQYKNAKIFENEPDTDEEDEDGCPICNEEEDEKGNPVKEMSCGHKIHISCLIKTAKGMGRDKAECPLCRKKFSLLEVPVPARDTNQIMADTLSNAIRDASQNESEFLSDLIRLERQMREPVQLQNEEIRGLQNEEINPNFRDIARQINATRIHQDVAMEENEIESIRQLIRSLEETVTNDRELQIMIEYQNKLRYALQRRSYFLQRQDNMRREREREERREREREERRQIEREREERRQRDMEEIGQTRTRSGRVSRRRT